MTTIQTWEAVRLRDRRSVRALIRPLEELAHASRHLFTTPMVYMGSDGLERQVPRFLFIGPGSGGEYFRIGLFGGIHGDEPSGSRAVVEFIERLHANPELARGYEIFAYPACNPTGYVDGTRWSRSGKDLNREFWRGSVEPEVQLIERQLERLTFHGIVSLHSDDTSNGLYGFAQGHVLTRHVLEPALRRAERILPRNYDKSIDNFHANEGVIELGYPGMLSAPPERRPQPFEIVFETPHLAPIEQQVEAHCIALQEMLDRFLAMISEAQNI